CSVMIAVSFISPAIAQTPPARTAQQDALDYFVGTWKIDSEMKANPLGPAGRMMATERCEWFPGRFHLVCESEGTGPAGEIRSMAVMSYDTERKSHVYYAISSVVPDAEYAKGTKTADGWNWTSESRGDGKTVRSRFTMSSMTPANYQLKWEVNDGAGWTTVMTGTAVKIR
ncbi:MAG TPA: DUF1579 family protein, partial [Gemmatimonadaceae bacterium]|nr:DUF1579 family protein [Gemmatimonadaceae bacterium]